MEPRNGRLPWQWQVGLLAAILFATLCMVVWLGPGFGSGGSAAFNSVSVVPPRPS